MSSDSLGARGRVSSLSEDTELHPLERFARTLAGAIGWGQFSEADGDE